MTDSEKIQLEADTVNILIYDIDEDERFDISRKVKAVSPDSQVRDFGSAEEIIEHIKLHGVDVIFLEIDSCGGRGFFLAKEIQSIVPRVNLIFMSQSMKYTVEAMNLHASGYIGKPYTEETLSEELKNLRYA